MGGKPQNGEMDGLLHGKSYLEMDDDWGIPILGNPHM